MRRRILGIIGRLLILAALVAAAAEVYSSFDRSAYHIIVAEEVLLRLSPGGVAFLERSLPALLWDDLLHPFLRLPVWLLLVVPGLVMEYFHDVHQGHSQRHVA